MNSLFKRLKISQKLNLLGYFGVLGLIFSSVSIWFILQNLHSLSNDIQNYGSIKTRTSNIRVCYNAMRGDLLLMFILDPNVPEQVTKSNETIEHYNKMLSVIKDEQQKLIEESQKDTSLAILANKFSESVADFIAFTDMNSKKIKEARPEDSLEMAECRDILFNKFTPIYTQLIGNMDILNNGIDSKMKMANDDFDKANAKANIIIGIITLLVILIVTTMSKLISNNIASRLKYVSETLNQVARGDLPVIKHFDDRDEIGEMGHAFINLVSELNKLKQFTVAVGTGDYETNIVVFNNQGEISHALSGMKENLKIASDLKNIQNYTSEGLAKFANILRNDNNEHYFDDILSNLVKYVNANQGALYILEEEGKDKFLSRVATYAYNRKKYLQKKLEIGEGLAGQSVLEAATIHLTEIPQNYLEITSGLGDANPSALLIVPLKLNENVVGVIELASFNDFAAFEIEFVEKVAENIASAIISAKTNQRTKALLAISQQQTEEMRSQEEEMRQNMEEMQATQEEMERKELEMQNMIQRVEEQEEALRHNLEQMSISREELRVKNNEIERIVANLKQNEAVFTLTTILSESDQYGNVTYANQKLVEVSQYSMDEIIGKPHNLFRHPDMPKEIFKLMWDTIQRGETFKGIVKNKAKDGTHYWVDATIVPIKDQFGAIYKYIGARYHIVNDKIAEELYEQQLIKLGIK